MSDKETMRHDEQSKLAVIYPQCPACKRTERPITYKNMSGVCVDCNNDKVETIRFLCERVEGLEKQLYTIKQLREVDEMLHKHDVKVELNKLESKLIIIKKRLGLE